MARPLTIKQEKFCQLYIQNGGNASEAYRGAYSCDKMKSKSVNELSCRQMTNVNIASRIAELRAKTAKKHEITVDWLTKKYLETFQMACEQGKAGEAKGVLDSLGKLHGHMVEKKRIDGNIDINHRAESVSETTGWIEGMLGRPESNQIEASLPN